jgi:hypothetical protein
MNHRSPGRDHLRSLAILGNIETGGARHSVRAVMAMQQASLGNSGGQRTARPT